MITAQYKDTKGKHSKIFKTAVWKYRLVHLNVSTQVSQTESVSTNSYKGTYSVGPLERAISLDTEIRIDDEPKAYKGLVRLNYSGQLECIEADNVRIT